MIRYEIQLKQRSGKWIYRCERDTLEAMRVEWTRYIAEVTTRPAPGQRRLRCIKIEDGIRTVIAQHMPTELVPATEMTALQI